MSEENLSGWTAGGLLFENCNCTLVCPGHMHFSKQCTNDACIGYWAMRFDEGNFNGVDLAGVKAVIIFESPKRMIEGNWVQQLIFDSDTPSPAQEALEIIFKGEAGGPWEVLSRFVAKRLPSERRAIEMVDKGKIKTLKVEGFLESIVVAIKSKDKEGVVTLENMFNQIHPPSQVMALGTTSTMDSEIRMETEETHGLYSRFSWSGS